MASRLERVVYDVAGGTVIALLALASAGQALASQAAVTLPAGGGEPGKVYMEQQRALKAKDIPALKKLVSAARVKEMDDPKFKQMLGMIVEMMPPNIAVVGGTETGDTAILKTTGGTPAERQTGEVTMVKEGGAWKVDKESWKQ